MYAAITAEVMATAWTATPSSISRLITGSFVGRGGRCMMSGSPFSRPSARAGAPSVTRFSHSSWIGRSGMGRPTNIDRKMMRISPMLHEIR